eukprot:3342430-Amphidinium_carterae.2
MLAGVIRSDSANATPGLLRRKHQHYSVQRRPTVECVSPEGMQLGSPAPDKADKNISIHMMFEYIVH